MGILLNDLVTVMMSALQLWRATGDRPPNAVSPAAAIITSSETGSTHDAGRHGEHRNASCIRSMAAIRCREMVKLLPEPGELAA
jgi:hypothetical protein